MVWFVGERCELGGLVGIFCFHLWWWVSEKVTNLVMGGCWLFGGWFVVDVLYVFLVLVVCWQGVFCGVSMCVLVIWEVCHIVVGMFEDGWCCWCVAV